MFGEDSDPGVSPEIESRRGVCISRCLGGGRGVGVGWTQGGTFFTGFTYFFPTIFFCAGREVHAWCPTDF